MLRVFFKSGFFKSNAHALRHLEYLNKQGRLFNGTREVDLETQKTDAEKFPETPKRWFVYSLTREDQQRLEIDRGYFQDLMEAQRLVWAKAYNIPPDRLHICASFHDVAHHPHIHVVLHGETPSDGYIVQRKGQELGEAFKRCRETVKGAITQEIYRGDTEGIKADKGRHRQQLNAQLEKLLLEIGKTSHCISPDIRETLVALAGELAVLPGKHQYGYLPPQLKTQVDTMLQELVATDPSLRELFELYRKNQSELVKHQYVGKEATLAKKMKEWEEAFFHPAKGEDTRRHNLIIQAAETYSGGIGSLQPPDLPVADERLRHEPIPEAPTPEKAVGQTPSREDAERNRKKSELKQQILHELERELSGPLHPAVVSAFHGAAPQEGGWQQQADETREQIRAAEKAVLNEFPALAEKMAELAEQERVDSSEFLEKAGWLHRRMLQYSRCFDRERGIIDFGAVRALRAENGALVEVMQAVRTELIQLLDAKPGLRPQPKARLKDTVKELAELCMKKTAVAAAMERLKTERGDDAWPRKIAESVVQEALQEYLPPEDRRELARPPASPPSPEMQALMCRVRADLEQRLKKSTALQAALGAQMLKIHSKLNCTQEYRYASLPTVAEKMVDEVVQMLLQQSMVRRLLKAENCTEPDLSVLREWVTEYACAATAEQPVDLTIPQKRRGRHKLLCAFDKCVCQELNNVRRREGCLALAKQCLGDKEEQKGEKTEKEEANPSYWKLNQDGRDILDDWICSRTMGDTAFSKIVQETAALYGEEGWLDGQLKKGWLQNIVLERLAEWRETPDKPIEPKYAERYKPKTLDAFARNLLYLIAATMRDDVLREQGRMPDQNGAAKFKRKRIHKRTIEERHEEVYR